MTHPLTIEKAAALIEKFEGVEVESYLDPQGVPTICTGLTKYSNGDPVRMGDVCFAAICTEYTKEQIERDVLPEVSKIPGWDNLGPNRQAVIISFAWNMSIDFFEKPEFENLREVLKEGAKHPEAYEDVPFILGLFNKSYGEQLPGLMFRREMESDEWRKESVLPIHLEASDDTFIKKAPINHYLLSEEGKNYIETDEVLLISRLEEIPRDNHALVTLIGSGEKWFIEQRYWRERNATNFSIRKNDTVTWNVLEDRVGKYITVGEMLQYDPRRAPVEGSKDILNLLQLAEQFDSIREAWGAPIGVLGGYRPEEKIKDNYHSKGMALDIYPVEDDLVEFSRWLSRRWTGGFLPNKEKGYVHIDIRKNGAFYTRPQQSLKSLAI
ncbi:MAG: hypothetical protein CMB24_01760 [Euryarchaeota archaeon]|nr:hypothetical protein [Euryarchaeota archaeon]|tara:strand:+ start:3250 stop:4395 length:1146 start_codon:yes stop_codon:yes gene_type:complete